MGFLATLRTGVRGGMHCAVNVREVHAVVTERKSMNNKLAGVIIVAAIGLAGYFLASVGRDPSEYEVAQRLRKAAPQKMAEECTNNVVGISRILKLDFDGYGSMPADQPRSHYNPKNWRGEAQVEYVNRIGGVERTNLHFVFDTYAMSDGGFSLTCRATTDPKRF